MHVVSKKLILFGILILFHGLAFLLCRYMAKIASDTKLRFEMDFLANITQNTNRKSFNLLFTGFQWCAVETLYHKEIPNEKSEGQNPQQNSNQNSEKTDSTNKNNPKSEFTSIPDDYEFNINESTHLIVRYYSFNNKLKKMVTESKSSLCGIYNTIINHLEKSTTPMIFAVYKNQLIQMDILVTSDQIIRRTRKNVAIIKNKQCDLMKMILHMCVDLIEEFLTQDGNSQKEMENSSGVRSKSSK